MEQLAPEIIDPSLLIKHNEYSHMGCVLLRSIIGITLISNASTRIKKTITMIMIVTLLIFTFKYIFVVLIGKKILWKNYPRFIFMYTMALYLLHIHEDRLAGLIIIMDAMMGLDSRHTSAVISKLNKK